MATNYQRGAAFELRVKKRLEEQGWTVWRTPGSKSPADLIAVKPSGMLLHCDWDQGVQPRRVRPRVRLVQCKSGTTTLGPKARKAFFEYAAGLGAEPVLAERGMRLSRIRQDGEREAA